VFDPQRARGNRDGSTKTTTRKHNKTMIQDNPGLAFALESLRLALTKPDNEKPVLRALLDASESFDDDDYCDQDDPASPYYRNARPELGEC
jgi:hypothetical protein